jgi:hypothetical protein
MKSPFPGMDPYLEQRWRDFHNRFATYACDALQPDLPADLRARIEERVYVESFDFDARQVVPDVEIYETTGKPQARGGTAAAVAEDVGVAQPFVVFVPLEITERYVQIVDVRTGGTVVTVIELLSPSNKTSGRGREEYVGKQRQTVQAGVNLVEIDLIRGGQPTTLAKPGLIPPHRLATYHASIYRGADPDRLEFYAMPLRQRLPRLPIPLRRSDPRVILDLQGIVDTAFDRGRYDDIDYSQPLNPPLDPADEQWARERVAAALAGPPR